MGLVIQYHYVGLGKQPVPKGTSDATGDVGSTDDMDDAPIEEGDEHTGHITGGPRGSMLTTENPEADPQLLSVAPAEGQKLMDIMTDKHFEAMCNPDKFCLGTGTFSTEQPKKLTYKKYFNQRLLDVDSRFAKDLEYFFVAQYIVENKQIRDDGNNFVWRQKPSGRFSASQARDQATLNQYVRKDKAYRPMKNITYYQRTSYDLLAMIRQLGMPTWFFSPVCG